jgi:hypothetical protein
MVAVEAGTIHIPKVMSSRAHILPLAIALAATLFAGCATLNNSERQLLENHRVPAPLSQKMVHRRPLTLADISELSARHVPPAFIIRYVDDSLAEYQLTTDEVLRLRRSGVSHEVIDFLLTTPQRAADALLLRRDPFWPSPYYRQPIIIHHHHKRRGR